MMAHRTPGALMKRKCFRDTTALWHTGYTDENDCLQK